MGNDKFQTSNVAVCLKAIKDYVELDLKNLGEEEKVKKDLAQKAVDHLSLLFSPEVENVLLYECPSKKLPTIN